MLSEAGRGLERQARPAVRTKGYAPIEPTPHRL